jgi:hypothetical protein
MQEFFALIIVAIAAAYLAWRGWKFFTARKKSIGCGSACGGCSNAQAHPTVHAISAPRLD